MKSAVALSFVLALFTPTVLADDGPAEARQKADAARGDAAVVAAAGAHDRRRARREAQQEALLAPAEPPAETLRDALARDVEFMAKVGSLPPASANRWPSRAIWPSGRSAANRGS